MKTKTLLLSGVGAIAALALAPQAMAQESGWYGAFDLGYHAPESIDTSSEGLANDGLAYRYKIQQEDNLAGFARIGYQITPHWRVELEGGVRTGDIESISQSPTVPARPATIPNEICGATLPLCDTGVDGSVEAYTLMANVIYDFFPNSSFRPFIGAGVGVNYVDMEFGGRFNTNPLYGTFAVHDNDTAFAWQFLGGLAFDITDRLTGDLTYRYLDGNDMRFSTSQSATSVLLPAVGDIEGQYEDQSLTFGLRYSFAQAAPPPPPPPEPPAPPPPPPPEPTPPPPPPPPAPVAKEFIVYFPFDQSILTPEAQAVVSEAAQYASSGNATQIVVVGHADTSGSAKYNVGLSQRRSKAVADALVGLGVDSGKLAVDWKGESEPAVATGDGVKEPLNRRSTIQINF
ncbi:OmpA family protein [Caulobacter sp. NIBR1757]|uniref:OmpA family protein n=1 Tax=Caulobacter sp. NIBR1757 TaxID=3016000 RepID=UPI0022F0CF66|nr:OmpA family protein [Caulobacter sp. NIBR1757]WGM37412.1 Outer membrane protein [Caulobacter sp. NIBR1757]